jgi:hypothetical protein
MCGRLIAEPFVGIGLAVPENALTYGEPHGDQKEAQELASSVEEPLPSWSVEYPAITFVFMRADCFGGIGFYEGYICRNGMILIRAKDDQKTENEGGAALRQLVAALGVQLPDHPGFVPFTRGFFDADIRL